MAALLKTALIRVSSIQIMHIRVQNKGKSVWKVDTTDISEHYMPSLMALKKALLGRQPGSFRESFISVVCFHKV